MFLRFLSPIAGGIVALKWRHIICKMFGQFYENRIARFFKSVFHKKIKNRMFTIFVLAVNIHMVPIGEVAEWSKAAHC